MRRDFKKTQWLFILGLIILLSPIFSQPAWGNIDREGGPAHINKSVGKSSAWWKRITAFATLRSSLGAGSFSSSALYKNHYFAQSLSMNLGYNIWQGLFIQGGWGFDLEYTQPDNASGRRFFARDVNLAVGWNNPLQALRKVLNHSIRVNVQLPTSPLAQIRTRLLRLDASLAASLNIVNIVRINYSFGVSKGFHRYTTPIFNQGSAITPSVFMRQAARESSTLSSGQAPIPAGRNISWQLRNIVSVSVHPHRTVAIRVAFGIFNAFKYPTAHDNKTPIIPTKKGNILADAVGRFDLTMGDISVSWRPIRHLGLALGATSFQSPFTRSGGLRVPFLNLATPNDNTTTFYLNITGSY